MKLEEWIQKGRESGEITFEEGTRFYITRDKEVADAARADIIHQYWELKSEYTNSVLKHYKDNGIERGFSAFCSEAEWYSNRSGELYEVIGLCQDRIRTEPWWRKTMVKELQEELDNDKISNYAKTGIELAIKIIEKPTKHLREDK
jgi:hypothetical protein